MNWFWSDAIRKTASMSGFRWLFIASIWNTYSKSVTAPRPRMTKVAPIWAANSMSSQSKGSTVMDAFAPGGRAATSPGTMYTQTSTQSGSTTVVTHDTNTTPDIL